LNQCVRVAQLEVFAVVGADVPSARVRANIGLAVGLVLGLLLALAEVTVAVRFESDEVHGPRYRVVVLGVVVFRYPEDGELYAMRPFAQARAVRGELVWAATLAGGAIGWVTGYTCGRLTRRRT
jgi:hypothetical protein